MDDDAVIKVIVIGDSLVGKTSFIQRYVNNSYRSEYKSTIGVDFALKIINWKDGVKIKLQLWDIAGQERFTFMTRAYYKDAKGCLLLFDLSNATSFERARKWKSDLDAKIRQNDGTFIPCLLVGNKSDLAEREVSKQQMASLCQELKFVGWTETSVKEGTLVNEAAAYLMDVMMGSCPPGSTGDRNGLTESVILDGKRMTKDGKTGNSKCFAC